MDAADAGMVGVTSYPGGVHGQHCSDAGRAHPEQEHGRDDDQVGVFHARVFSIRSLKILRPDRISPTFVRFARCDRPSQAATSSGRP